MFALTIADDLTGAAETAAALARVRGEPVRVVTGGAAARDGDVVVLPTRPSTPARAYLVADRLALPAQGTVFVKIDSTLRGPWVELVEHLAQRLDCEPLIAPAFPARRRTVDCGVPMVDGEPLFASTFRSEIAGEDEISTLEELVHQRAPELRAFMPDAATDGDMDALARDAFAQGLRLLVGSAGLAEACARVARDEGKARPDPMSVAPAAQGPAVIAAGSRAAATTRQTARVAQRATVLRGRSLRALAQRAVEAANGGTIVACGGETAWQVLQALRAHGTVVYGEAAPAIVLTRPFGCEITLLTKSGSLGADDAIAAALEALRL